MVYTAYYHDDTHCFMCREALLAETHPRCQSCAWLISRCGACGCYWKQFKQMVLAQAPGEAFKAFKLRLKERAEGLGVFLPGAVLRLNRLVLPADVPDILGRVQVDIQPAPDPDPPILPDDEDEDDDDDEDDPDDLRRDFDGNLRCDYCNEPAEFALRHDDTEEERPVCTFHIETEIDEDDGEIFQIRRIDGQLRQPVEPLRYEASMT